MVSGTSGIGKRNRVSLNVEHVAISHRRGRISRDLSGDESKCQIQVVRRRFYGKHREPLAVHDLPVTPITGDELAFWSLSIAERKVDANDDDYYTVWVFDIHSPGSRFR